MLYRNNAELFIKDKIFNNVLQANIRTINNLDYSQLMPYLYICLLSVSINVSYNYSTEYILNNSAQFNKAFNFIEVNFQSPVKDFLLARTIYTALDNNIVIQNDYLKRFNTECTDANYKRIVNNKLSEKAISNTNQKGNTVLLMNTTQSDFKVLINNNKGKLIYIDFWASWCAPCRSEMPHSVKLRKLFEKKGVVFLYVSIDKNISDWRKASQEENMSIDNSYLMLNSDQSSFIKQHKINSIPRYILIVKK